MKLQKMEEEKPLLIRRFFKIMLPGFHQKLNLPQNACKNLSKDRSLPEEGIILETRLGRWRIRVCKNRDGLIWFADGWPVFVNDHALSVGDLVVFEPTGNFNFKVVVFDISACEKEFLQLQHPIEEDPPKPIKRELEIESRARECDYKEPYFILRMSPYHSNRSRAVRVPAKFMRNNNMEGIKSIIVRDPRGREWTVRVSYYVEKSGLHTCRLGSGWHAFYNGNKLNVEDVCIFRLVESKCFPPSNPVFDVQFRRRP